MTRTNLILAGVLVLLVAVWFVRTQLEGDDTTGPAPRLFPEFNKEAADRIEIEGGWQGSAFAFEKHGTDWELASAGDYPVKNEAVHKLLDAVASLREDNVAGSDAELRRRTHTDEENGRLVRVLRAGEPMAAFFVGKNPERAYQDFFMRRKAEETIYRTRTTVARDEVPALEGAELRGFDWHNYVNNLGTKWVDTAIWDLQDAEATELWLTRHGAYEVKLVKKGQDKWELIEGEAEPVAADADVVDGILGNVRRLTLYEVAGKYDEVRGEYGLEQPEITLVLKLRKKVEKKEAEGGEGESEAEGEESKAEPAEEYVTIHRVLEVGRKVERRRYEAYSDEFKTEEYYAIHVGPDGAFENADEEMRTEYVFLVDDYKVGGLRKELADLKAKAPDEDDAPDGGGAEPEDGGAGEKEPGDGGEGAEPGDGATRREAGDEGTEPPADEGAEGCGAGEDAEGCGTGEDEEGCGTGEDAEGCGTGEDAEGCGTGEDEDAEGCGSGTGGGGDAEEGAGPGAESDEPERSDR